MKKLTQMERLTHKTIFRAGYKANRNVLLWQCIDRLGQYEDTGLTPEQIREIDRLHEVAEYRSKRKYVIVCNEHSGMFRGALLFWGNRTQDGDKRSFGGYTSDIDNCELYSEKDLKGKGCNFPKYYKGMTWEEFRKYDDIVIEPDCLFDLGYKQMKVLFMP